LRYVSKEVTMSSVSAISSVASSVAPKYVAPTKTAVDSDGDNDGSTAKVATESAAKAVSSISLKGHTVDKTA
jgi:hypothetical protein